MKTFRTAVIVLVLVAAGRLTAMAQDPLPSWNDGPAKKSIVDFVKATTDKSSPKFVAPEARVATFDQDGTLWVSHPVYGPATGLPDTKVGTFTQALYDEAKKKGWTVISMKNDWKKIFAFE